MSFCLRAEIRGQSIHRTDKIGNGDERRRLPAPQSGGVTQTLVHHLGLGKLPLARLRLDLRHEGVGQADGELFHAAIVLRWC
jgi:hypothetical protein